MDEEFDKIASISLPNKKNAFHEVRTDMRNSLIKYIKDHPQITISTFSDNLYSWAQNRIHKKELLDTLISLSVFSFLLDLGLENRYQQTISRNIEHLLPTESLDILRGTWNIIKLLDIRISEPLQSRLFERCITWLTTRITIPSTITATYLLNRILTANTDHIPEIAEKLTTMVWNALKFESTQEGAITLCETRIAWDPSANSAVNSLLNDLFVSLESSVPPIQMRGSLQLLTVLFQKYPEACRDRVQDFLEIILNLLWTNPSTTLFQTIGHICEIFPNLISSAEKSIYDFILNNFLQKPNDKEITNNSLDFALKENWSPELSNALASLCHRFPSSIGKYVISLLNKSDGDLYFKIISSLFDYGTEYINTNDFLNALWNNDITFSYKDSVVLFLKKYPSHLFQMIPGIHTHIKYHLTNILFQSNFEPCLYLLESFKGISQFPITEFWDICVTFVEPESSFYSKETDIRVAAYKALLTIVCSDETSRREHLFYIFYHGKNDTSAKVRKSILLSVDQNLYPDLASPEFISLIMISINDKNESVAHATLKLIGNIRSAFPMPTLTFFQNVFSLFPIHFLQCLTMNQKASLMSLLPDLIISSGDFFLPHIHTMTEFLMKVLSTPFIPSKKINQLEQIDFRVEIKRDRQIKISGLKALACFSKVGLERITDLIHPLFLCILNLFSLYSHPAIHIEISNTLRILFREKEFSECKLIDQQTLHQTLFSQILKSRDSARREAILRLLGTIGTINPDSIRFANQSNSSLLYSKFNIQTREKRDHVYLTFVLNYILEQLINRPHNNIPLYQNTIIYIIDTTDDVLSAFPFLEKFVPIFIQEEKENHSSENFVFLRNIVLTANASIEPYAKDIFELILPYLNPNPDPAAVRLLSSLAFTLKNNFKPFVDRTISKISAILSQYDCCDPEDFIDSIISRRELFDYQSNNLKLNEMDPKVIIFLLHVLLLTTLFCNVPSCFFFGIASRICFLENEASVFAAEFVAQAISSNQLPNLVFAAYALAIDILSKYSTVPYPLLEKLHSFPSDSFETTFHSIIPNSKSLDSNIKIQNDKLTAVFLSSSNLSDISNNQQINDSENQNTTKLNDHNDSHTHLISTSHQGRLDDFHSKMQFAAIQIINVIKTNFQKDLETIPYKLSDVEFNYYIKIAQEKQRPILSRVAPQGDPLKPRKKPSLQRSFLKDIFERENLRNPKFIMDIDWENWILKFTSTLVICSTSGALRSTIPLLHDNIQFVQDIFPLALVSAYDDADPDERKMLTDYLYATAHNSQAPHQVLDIIVRGCEAMDRANMHLFNDSAICGQIAERCNMWYDALRFFEKATPMTDDWREHLLRINAKLKRPEYARGCLKGEPTNAEVLEDLSMWGPARAIYESKLVESPQNEKAFLGFIECCGKLEDYQAIERKLPLFKEGDDELRSKAAVFFAAAARWIEMFPEKNFDSQNTKITKESIDNKKKVANDILKLVKIDNGSTCKWHAIVSIDNNDLDDAEIWIDRGIRAIAQDTSYFISGNYEPAIPSITGTMIFEELRDVIEVRRGNIPYQKVVDFWDSKNEMLKKEPSLLRNLHRVRSLLYGYYDSNELIRRHLSYLNSMRNLGEWEIFDNSFDRLLGENVNSLAAKLILTKARYDRRLTTDLHEFNEILIESQKEMFIHPYDETIQKDYCNIVYGFVTRSPPSTENLPLIKRALEIQPKSIQALKLWAYTNLTLSRNEPKYAKEAANGFISLHMRDHSLHYLCQLISLVFSYGTQLENFQTIQNYLTNLSPDLSIDILPQLFVQLSNPNLEVQAIVVKMIEKCAEVHFQALALSLKLIENTSSSSQTSSILIDKLTSKHKAIMQNVESFNSLCLTITRTPIDLVLKYLEKIQLIRYQIETLYFDAKSCILTTTQKKSSISSRSIGQKILKKSDSLNPLSHNKSKSIMPNYNSTTSNANEPVFSMQSGNSSVENFNEKSVKISNRTEDKVRVTSMKRPQSMQQDMGIELENLSEEEQKKIHAKQKFKHFYRQLQENYFKIKELITESNLATRVFEYDPRFSIANKIILFLQNSADMFLCSAGDPFRILDEIEFLIHRRIENIHSFDIFELSSHDIQTSFPYLSVPGFYSPNNFITIQQIKPILKIIPSAKLPRKIRLIGSNGKTYKYLIKGNEDVRLDQRIMQLFSLTNSILASDRLSHERNLKIQRYPIIPVSVDAGLIAWAEGGETLYSLIKNRRDILLSQNSNLISNRNSNNNHNNNSNNHNNNSNNHNNNSNNHNNNSNNHDNNSSNNNSSNHNNSNAKTTNKVLIKKSVEIDSDFIKNDQNSNKKAGCQNALDIEMNIIDKFMGNGTRYGRTLFSRLTFIQKVELFRNITQTSGDEDLQESLWLNSMSAQEWIYKVTSFAQSNALMSMIGYILGLGDRHPSNILVKKGSGDIVHIDFSDCFEKAKLRKILPETVPFRLTRMIIKALGTSGTKGPFTNTSRDVMKILRKNQDTLLAFLDIFVQDPITDMGWYLDEQNFNYESQTQNHDNSMNNDENKKKSFRKAIDRVKEKLNGLVFSEEENKEMKIEPMSVEDQVDYLIKEATDDTNLSQMYIGWAPFW